MKETFIVYRAIIWTEKHVIESTGDGETTVRVLKEEDPQLCSHRQRVPFLKQLAKFIPPAT